MKRLHQTTCLAVVLCTLSTLHAQVVAITPNSNSTATTSVDDAPASTTSASSGIDYSMMNWRAGLLSPYLSSNMTSSTTTGTVVPAVPINNNPTVNNPYAASAVTQTSQTLTPVASTSNSVIQSTTPNISSRFAPRFVSFSSISTDLNTNSGINGVNNGPTVNFNLNTNVGGSTNFLASVPEPSTMVMCAGLLALAGYGYARRGSRKAVTPEAAAILQGETSESISQ
jgi:hypothetical protein